jgi:hypothetical protein
MPWSWGGCSPHRASGLACRPSRLSGCGSLSRGTPSRSLPTSWEGAASWPASFPARHRSTTRTCPRSRTPQLSSTVCTTGLPLSTVASHLALPPRAMADPSAFSAALEAQQAEDAALRGVWDNLVTSGNSGTAGATRIAVTLASTAVRPLRRASHVLALRLLELGEARGRL